MKKQIKLVAVLSTAAFLAVCQPLLSFAASGWIEENGGWTYYNEKGERLSENWVKNKNQWYWIDENGFMVAGGLFPIHGDYYYFLEDGTMAADQWIKIPGEDTGAEGEESLCWYYFGKDGRALKSTEDGSLVTAEIEGEKYAFDAKGRMIQGWVSGDEDEGQEDTWTYYNEKGEQVKENWVQKGDQWYWIDEKGEMAFGGLRQIKNDYYYFREDGSRVSEEWVAIPNENAGKEGEPDRYWYYFQKNGKAYRRPDSASSGSLKAKTIDGKKYAFDTEGRMLYSWVADGERQTDEDAWTYCDYYFGTEDNGAMQQGWARLPIDAESIDDIQPGYDFWDEDQERWFYFNANGKKTRGREGDLNLKTINGSQYGFDEYGRMVASWYADPDILTLATNRTEAGLEGKGVGEFQGQAPYTRQFMYFGPPESGARYKKGWFKAIPSEYLAKTRYDDQEMRTYYADKDGSICASEIKLIDGERYGFDSSGQVMSGLVCVEMESKSTSKRITNRFYADASPAIGRAPFGSEEEFDELVETYAEKFRNHKMRFYYFGGLNGAMLTGKQKITLGVGEAPSEFMFETSGRYKGSGVYGEKNNRLYKAGKLLKPDEGEKYAIFKQTYDMLPEDATSAEQKAYDPDNNGKIEGIITRITVEEFISEVCNSGIYDEKRDETVWTVRYNPPEEKYYLVDANGNIVKNKSAATNEDGYKFRVKNKSILTITAEN